MLMPDDFRRSLAREDEGTDWLYRDVPKRLYRRVVLLVVPSDAPKRVRIQHLDPEMKGSAEWVPAGRLKVPDGLAAEYLASVAAVDRVAAHAPGTAITDLAETVLSKYLPRRVASMEFTSLMGALSVVDLGALAELTGLEADKLTNHADAIAADDGWLLPWPTVERVVVALLHRNPGPGVVVLDELIQRRQAFDRLVEEEGERWWMRDDAPSSARGPRKWHDMQTEQLRQLRQWLDQDQPTLAQSYLELRGLHTEMVAALREAIPRVRMGRSQTAYRIADRMQELVDRPTPLLDVRGTREPARDDVGDST